MTTAREALDRLREGNQRFVADPSGSTVATAEGRRALLAGQNPFAVILGCADSRVPAEIVFDQGLGDLFVIRVAGNIVAPTQMGSIEFAVERFGTRLVVVLGHTGCGAIAATLEQLEHGRPARTPGLAAIYDRIRPVIEPLAGSADIEAKAVRANIEASVEKLRTGSPALRRLGSEGLMVIGAEYALDTGVVRFFDDAS